MPVGGLGHMPTCTRRDFQSFPEGSRAHSNIVVSCPKWRADAAPPSTSTGRGSAAAVHCLQHRLCQCHQVATQRPRPQQRLQPRPEGTRACCSRRGASASRSLGGASAPHEPSSAPAFFPRCPRPFLFRAVLAYSAADFPRTGQSSLLQSSRAGYGCTTRASWTDRSEHAISPVRRPTPLCTG
jgi:hypothetical protein